MSKRNPTSAKRSSRPAGSTGWSRTSIVVAVLAAGALFASFRMLWPKPPEAGRAEKGALAQPRPADPTVAPIQETQAAVAAIPAAVAAVSPVRTAPPVLPVVPAADLIGRLAGLETNTVPLTAAQANKVDQTVKQLIAQGPSSIAAIGDYLSRLGDVSLEAQANLLKFPTLRSSLIDALAQIGGSEASELMGKTLRTTADPFEIALLGKYLEQQAPGQFKGEVVNAAREALKMAAQDQLGGRDVAPLFQVLQKAEDPEAQRDMEAASSKWNYYSTMALAALPDGSGVKTLVGRVQDPEAGDKTETRFAWQMLAQLSSRYPEARDMLVSQARAGTIPDGAWSKIATGLAGDQYQFGDSRLRDVETPTPPTGLKTYHIQAGNQNFFSLPLGVGGPVDLAERQSLVDSLLSQDLSAVAKQSLQTARASLGGIKAGP